MKKLAVLILVGLLGGCTTGARINWNDPAQITPLIRVERDEFKKVTTYIGPTCSSPICSNFWRDNLFLRAWKVDGGSSFDYQIYITDVHYEWRYFDQAHDSDGTTLKLTQISSNVSGCSGSSCALFEVVGIDVSREYLSSHQVNGIKLQVSGKGGKEQFYLSGQYISAFLSAVK